MTFIEAVVAAVGAIAGGGGTVAVMRRTRGTPEDFDRRLVALEGDDGECKDRLRDLEARMQQAENAIAAALGKLTESNDRLWKSVDKLTSSVEDLRGDVVKLNVEAAFERSLRRRSQAEED